MHIKVYLCIGTQTGRYCLCYSLYIIRCTTIYDSVDPASKEMPEGPVCAHIKQIQQLETALGRGTMAVSGRMGFPSSLREVLPPMHVETSAKLQA